MSSLTAHGKLARTKTNTQSNTKTHRTQRRNRHLEKKLFFQGSIYQTLYTLLQNSKIYIEHVSLNSPASMLKSCTDDTMQ